MTHRLAPLLLLAAIFVAARPSVATEVGLASVDIEPPIGIPLAGYGARARRLPKYADWGDQHEHAAFFRPSTGRHSAIESKAMVIRRDGAQVIFVSVDLVGVEKRMVRDVAKRLASYGVEEHQLLLGATHTHSGPGTLSRRPSMAIIAADRFRKENYELVVGKIAASIEQAFLALRPAELVSGQFRTEGLQRNKWRRKGEQHFDTRARLLLARDAETGELFGGVLNYALHGNGMPVDDLRYSSDTLGSIANNLESELQAQGHSDPVILYFNGAEGDVGNRARSLEAVAEDGESFAQQASTSGVFDELLPVGDGLSVTRRKVWLGLPGMSFRNCLGKWNGGESDPGPDPRLPLWLMQQRTWVSLVSLGNVHMLSWPGEPSVQVGYDTQAMAEAAGFSDSWILGLTGDYQSYFTTREEYFEGAYDSCSSLFRWKGTERIQKALGKLMSQ